jgi:hypothetical protein
VLFAIKTTDETEEAAARMRAQSRLDDEIALWSAHINAATARWIELVLAFRDEGGVAGDDFARWLAFRCGISTCEAREYVRVGEELPLTRGAFARGEITFSKLRALTRVATPASEEALIELVLALTTSHLERALRAFRRISREKAGDSHELEYVDYYWGEDGSLFLRARLPAEDGTLLVRALDAARERVRERQRDGDAPKERTSGVDGPPITLEPPRSTQVEALVDLAHSALAGLADSAEQARLLVHVDATALADDRAGRSEFAMAPSSLARPLAAWAVMQRR